MKMYPFHHGKGQEKSLFPQSHRSPLLGPYKLLLFTLGRPGESRHKHVNSYFYLVFVCLRKTKKSIRLK